MRVMKMAASLAMLAAGLVSLGVGRATPAQFAPHQVEKKGCCSHHKGVCGCEDGRAKCCDGVLSPTCGC